MKMEKPMLRRVQQKKNQRISGIQNIELLKYEPILLYKKMI